MVRQYGSKRAGQLRHSKNHVRQNLASDDGLRDLGRSFLERPLQPIIAGPDLEVLDGNRRLAGVLLVAGPDAEVPVCITDEAVNDAIKLEIQMESAIHQRGLIPFELFTAFSQWRLANPTATANDLAERIHRDPGTISKVLSLGKCIPAWHEAAAAGRVGIADWVEAAKLDAHGQHELLARKLAGCSAHELASEVRRKKNGNGERPAVRMSRVKVPLPSGATVSIAGKELSMDQVCEALAEALKDARAAQDKYDVKTWQSMCRDRYKSDER